LSPNFVTVPVLHSPMVVGTPALKVMSIIFGSTNTVNLYVNPTSLGGSAPSQARLIRQATVSPSRALPATVAWAPEKARLVHISRLGVVADTREESAGA
jgi:hypothetical protein